MKSRSLASAAYRVAAPSEGLPRLRVWAPGDEPAAPSVAIGPNVGDGLHSEMTLREFFERWYVPNVMHRQKRCSEETIALYRQSIGHWVRLTSDPPIGQIDEETLYDRFAEGLRQSTYRRGLSGRPRLLSEQTAVKHQRHVRAVYFRCGPKTDPKRPSKGLVEEIQHLVIASPAAARVKPKFSVEQARKVFAACDEMTAFGARGGSTRGRKGDGGPDADHRWRAFIACCYYGGQRFEAMESLRWSMLVYQDGSPFFEIPAECVKGRKAGVTKYVHPHAHELLRRLPHDDADGLIFPWLSRHSHTHLLNRHYWLQERAGTRTEIDLHGWRRTHDTEMYRLGLGEALELARRAACHSDARTTRTHYVEVEPPVIDLLPPLDPHWRRAPVDDPSQRKLF